MRLVEISTRQKAHHPTRLTRVNVYQSEDSDEQKAACCSFAISGPTYGRETVATADFGTQAV